MSDLRFRVALRNYLADQTPANAEAALQAAIRAGIINTGQEPEESPFGDMGMAYIHKGVYRGLSKESQLWINRQENESLFNTNYIIEVNCEWERLEEDDETLEDELVEDPPPQELQDLLDAASSEGYDYLAFE